MCVWGFRTRLLVLQIAAWTLYIFETVETIYFDNWFALIFCITQWHVFILIWYICSYNVYRQYIYSNNRVTCTDINSGDWGKIVYPGGPKLWRRVVLAFTIMALFGAIFVILGAVFLENAKKIQEDSGISLPIIWCIIGMGMISFRFNNY